MQRSQTLENPASASIDFYAHGDRLRGGRFVVRSLHAVGGMSAVYQAEQRTGWGRTRLVALKVAAPRSDAGAMTMTAALAAAQWRLAHEAILLRLVDHWRVPRVVGLFEERERLHLAMDFVPGRTLERLLTDASAGMRPPWPEASVVALGRALADLLAALHAGAAPVLVRDLKPGNLIVTPEGHVKLVDLGIACQLRRGERVPTSERWLGTRGYAAPEQCVGDGREDEREDLYALGAVLYRVATGWDPARAEQRFTFPPARRLNPALSPRLEALLADLLQVDAGRRPPSASFVRQALVG
jgi:serine/threonine protein kinase